MPSVTRQSTKERQTRLVLTPLPSSSPAAAVRYTDPSHTRLTAQYHGSTTPSKRRRLDKASDVAPTEPEFAAEESITPPRSSNLTAVMITTPSGQSKVDKDALSLLPSPRRSSQVHRVGSSRGTVLAYSSYSTLSAPLQNYNLTEVFIRRFHRLGDCQRPRAPQTGDSECVQSQRSCERCPEAPKWAQHAKGK